MQKKPRAREPKKKKKEEDSRDNKIDKVDRKTVALLQLELIPL